MKAFIASFFVFSIFVLSAQASAATLAEENFAGGAADWVDLDRNAVTWNSSGGHDGGAYISTTRNINSAPPGVGFGGYIRMRCAVAPPQLPAQNCSGGGFVGDWWYGVGVQELRFYMRHNSALPGGLRPFIRIPTPANNPGFSGIPLPAIPANTWQEVVIEIDPQSPDIDPQWGTFDPDPESLLTNVGRLQPGFFIDPADPNLPWNEANVQIDIDDVRLVGSTPIPADIIVEGVLTPNGPIHPHHYGQGSFPDDLIPVVILGSDTGAGDPVDLSDNAVVASSVRFKRGAPNADAIQRNFDKDSDGIEDARVKFRTSKSGFEPDCSDPGVGSLRGDLNTGEIFVGTDGDINKNCFSPCHN